jgi:hypothetical protein
MVYSKPHRIVDKKAIEAVRSASCEVCDNAWNPSVHHIKSKGSGGDDIPLNLICLCCVCHTKAHAGKINKKYLLNIAKRRELTNANR